MFKRASRITTFALLLVAFIGLQTADAQSANIGYTNQELLLANMPQIEQVNQQLQQEMMQEQQEFQQEQQEFQEMIEQFQSQQSLLSPERRQEREEELRQKQMELQQSEQQRQQALAQRERELMEPLLNDLQNAIETVASNNNLDLVVRSQALLYVDNQSVVDITEDVARQLGIDVDADAEVEDVPAVN